jgi:hypothetical protein
VVEMKRTELTETERETLEAMTELSQGTDRIPALRLQESDENRMIYAFLLPTNERNQNERRGQPRLEPGSGSN